jgi:glycine hydroxymethyltransferase
MDVIRPLEAVDPKVAAIIGRDVERQRTHVQLIASENFVSRAVMQASGSVLTNKYSEGYPGKRYYEGCELIDEMEALAAARARELFGAEHANVRRTSPGEHGVYFGLLKPGDRSWNAARPGRAPHRVAGDFSGILYDFVS